MAVLGPFAEKVDKKKDLRSENRLPSWTAQTELYETEYGNKNCHYEQRFLQKVLENPRCLPKNGSQLASKVLFFHYTAVNDLTKSPILPGLRPSWLQTSPGHTLSTLVPDRFGSLPPEYSFQNLYIMTYRDIHFSEIKNVERRIGQFYFRHKDLPCLEFSIV